MKLVMFCMALFLSGCYSTFKIDQDMLPKAERGKEQHKSVERILKHYFTTKAYNAIKNIPTIDGVGFRPYAIGVNGWSTFISVILGNGYSPKVFMTHSSLKIHGVESIIHEYIHHLDMMDRNGNGNWIDHDLFVKAYIRLAYEPKYIKLIRHIEECADFWVTNWFGVGKHSEHIAYLGAYVATHHNVPSYIKEV